MWTAAVEGLDEEKDEREDVRESAGNDEVSVSESEPSSEESDASPSESSRSDAVSPNGRNRGGQRQSALTSMIK